MITLLAILILSTDTTSWNEIRRDVDLNLKETRKLHNYSTLYVKMERERLRKQRDQEIEDSLFKTIKSDRFWVNDKIYRNGVKKDTTLYLNEQELLQFLEKKRKK